MKKFAVVFFAFITLMSCRSRENSSLKDIALRSVSQNYQLYYTVNVDQNEFLCRTSCGDYSPKTGESSIRKNCKEEPYSVVLTDKTKADLKNYFQELKDSENTYIAKSYLKFDAILEIEEQDAQRKKGLVNLKYGNAALICAAQKVTQGPVAAEKPVNSNTTIAQGADITPPTIESISFGSDEYQAGTKGKVIFKATDDLSGIADFFGSCWSIESETGKSDISVCNHVKKEGGNKYSMEFDINKFAESSTYTITYAYFKDVAGNSVSFWINSDKTALVADQADRAIKPELSLTKVKIVNK